MKRHSPWSISPIPALLLAVLLAASAVVFFAAPRLVFFVTVAVAAAVAAFALLRMHRFSRDVHRFIAQLGDRLESAGSEALSSFSIPILVTREDGAAIWYNDAFREKLLGQRDIYGDDVDFLLDDAARTALREKRRAEIVYGDQFFTVYGTASGIDGVSHSILYFIDETNYRRLSTEFALTRPAVAIVMIDSLDELLRGARDSERASITGAIESVIENWAAQTTALIRKLSNDRFLIVMEERHLQTYIDRRFDVLDSVRAIVFEGRGAASLSIGVGRGGATLRECEEMARQAMDMALGRGGDQAAVRSAGGGYDFYGGVSKGVQKHTRVRTRVVASALKELIASSDNVLIMGHRYADLDCFGASVGMWKAVGAFNKTAHIVMSRTKTLALPLLERLEQSGVTNLIVSPEEALRLIGEHTLLIIADVHRAGFLESEDVYRRAPATVVIDHHNMTVDYISNAVIFYHEPYASSASEMVAELVQYMGDRIIGKQEAEALMAGIMLDTKNFVIRTGVRTFEASAFLRGRGADPVAVRQLFSDSMEVYKIRAAIVSEALLYGDCAISSSASPDGDIRIAASQAADEMLNIQGVKASFVIYEAGGQLNISARSLGAVNVQLIMEALGGGGHQTMAACQLTGETFDTARNRLVEQIERYRASQVRPAAPARAIQT